MTRLVLILLAGMLLPWPAATPVDASVIPPETVPVHRFWSPVLGQHLYTLDEAQKQKLQSQDPNVWSYEGIAFRTFPSRLDPNLAPVHRFSLGSSGAQFYTLNEAEKDTLLRDFPDVWLYEGIAFYAYSPGRQPAGSLPVHRFWSGRLRSHFYTAGDTERFKLVTNGAGIWDYEGVAWYAYPAQVETAPAIVKGPFVQWVASDSAAIVWQTRTPADSVVQYGLGTPAGPAVFDPSAVTWHKVVLTGLTPGLVHAYRAASGATGETGACRTAPRADQPFRFAVYGDSRTYADTHRQVCAAIVGSEPDLVFHTGDLVGSGGNYDLWQSEFFDPARELLRNVPVIPVPGNHDYGGGVPWFFYFFHQPLDRGRFALTYGNARFLGLDTNVDYSADSPQYNWLVQELQSAECRTAAWRIVILHDPPFTSTTGHADNPTVQSQLVPLFEQYGVDAVFAGHSHAYERYLQNGIHYIVTGGGGAPLYDLAADLVPPVRQFGLSVHHYCVVDVDPGAGTLSLAAVDLSGRIFDAVTLSK
jgi:predicted phosphodiesterase